MKLIVVGKTPFRVVRRTKMAITIKPVDSEYPHILMLRRSISDPKRAEWQDQWGISKDDRRTVTWYRQISDDVFEKV